MDGETLAGWGAIARSPHGRIDVMLGLVITTEAHLAFSGARTHSNNTAEMKATIDALSFLGPRGPVARDENSCIYYDSKHAAGVCLGTIQARTHVQLALACQKSMLSDKIGYGLPCNTCTATPGIWGMNAPIIPPHLGHSALCLIITLLHVGFATTLIHLLVLVLALHW